ncbi:MAG: DNA gyrase inhibitor YacG [Phreatobacter sp.]|uniref:DNA gyrase inhibitor YacG n=1 Tax=Phreatobacter sp. TaxID=1966341 RepID=UPI001A52129A|nr:DNA gyrase inhibitor YacG [Phreatobacter sp.]MBL8571806.1 DNA gyrase inhibitor YacG [Phreatobacter sp.]
MSRRSTRAVCPICAKPAQAAFRPFCSVRCKDEDLRRWLVGAYRIPASPGEPPEDEDRAREEDQG